VPIHFERGDDHTAVITIDRPERRNSLDLYHFHDLAVAWREVRDDPEIWVAIITGVEENFCAGADLKDFIPQITELQKQIQAGEVTGFEGIDLRDTTDAVLKTLKLYKPIIAAIDGPCVAGGMEMLGGIDIRIATPRATFGVMEPKRGLFAGGGTPTRLPALEWGLVNRIVDPTNLMDEALAFAHRITANAPLAVQGTKEAVLRSLAAGSMKEGYQIENEISGVVFQSEDAKEGPQAFAEKRPPRWTGS
jgi:enoyl-CoA hydratase